MKGLRDNASATVTAEALESARSVAEPAATRGLPETVGPDSEQGARAGPLARLFLMISASPTETLQAQADLCELMMGERV